MDGDRLSSQHRVLASGIADDWSMCSLSVGFVVTDHQIKCGIYFIRQCEQAPPPEREWLNLYE